VKRFGGTTAVDQVTFALEDGLFLALLGPSGSGKTTVLRMLAGLETPDSGRITVHGRAVYDQGRSVPPEDRDIGMVFQDYALWPHMTVAQNIGFGLRLRRISRPETARKIDEALSLVHLEGLGGRYPDQLSGGQQQRVAIARALASRPRLLLLDEPLSNLDAALREEMRVELVRLLKDQGITAVYVTHDRIEALAMADRIVVLREGRIAQMGTPEELYHRPANPFIAGFLGAANFLSGEVGAGAGGTLAVRIGNLVLRGVAHGSVGTHGMLVLRPEDGIMHDEAPQDAVNVIEGTVVYSEFLGGRWRHMVSIGQDLTMQLLTPEKARRPHVWIHFPLERCLVLRDESANRAGQYEAAMGSAS
jgi:ABC-type Fe3+/spermidine/putrescine transport system ATPase subunit